MIIAGLIIIFNVGRITQCVDYIAGPDAYEESFKGSPEEYREELKEWFEETDKLY